MPSVHLLTEAGSNIGYGHFTRCQSIAKQFISQGWSAFLFVQFEGVASGLFPTESTIWRDMVERIPALIGGSDLVIIDSYKLSDQTLSVINAHSSQLAIIDDYPRRNYDRCAVIDWTLDAEVRFYVDRKPGVEYLLGASYCALRPALWKVPKRTHADLKSVLITFGGSDVRSLSVPCIEALSSQFPELEFRLVAPLATAKFITGRYPNVVVFSELEDHMMRDLMLSSDLAISGGGQTLYELACCGLPSIVIELIDNQLDDILGFDRYGFIDFMGPWDQPDLWSRVSKTLNRLRSNQKRTERGLKGQALIDGQGAFRLVKALINRTNGANG